MQLQRQHGSPETWIDSGQTMLDGPAREALRRAAAALDAAEARALPHEMSAVLSQMGRCYQALRAPSAAEVAYGQALRWARNGGLGDQQAELLCSLAETSCSLADALADDEPHAAHAARERARDRAFEASRLANRVGDAEQRVELLLRASDALNRCGDHDDATALQARALELMSQQPTRG